MIKNSGTDLLEQQPGLPTEENGYCNLATLIAEPNNEYGLPGIE